MKCRLRLQHTNEAPHGTVLQFTWLFPLFTSEIRLTGEKVRETKETKIDDEAMKVQEKQYDFSNTK